MPYLVVASITLNVTNQKGQRQPSELIGSSSRAYAGNLRSTRRADKRQWQVTTELMSTTDTATLEAAIALGVHVTCSGDMIGSSISCEVTVTGATDEIAGPTGLMRVLTLVLREV